jgi:hypothetical protein
MVLAATGAEGVRMVEPVQSLWSGYGQIVRCTLVGADRPSVIVKHVRWPRTDDHPRGWSSNLAHERKVRSYQVEAHFYRGYAPRCSSASRVPDLLGHDTHGGEVFLVLEDLDDAGFAMRRSHLDDDELDACLRWLAVFHATFMGQVPDGLWPVGTYWHLDTRPDELAALPDGKLKHAAAAIDDQLNRARYQTLVHGDAKVANFCFAADGDVAAVDFQYVGGGCGMKDVAYFISSCLDEDESERMESELLDRYFEHLQTALADCQAGVDLAELETEWRALYPVAWTDFYRFLQGWSPGHWKLHRYSERLAREVLDQL